MPAQRPDRPLVAVGLSGGVDSAVAALVLKKTGHEVVGLTMKTWDGGVAIPDEGRSGCYGPGEARDVESAAAVARKLGIPHHTVEVAREYRGAVLDYFRSEYLAGRTPNPCVRCNQRIKFGALIRQARIDGIRFDLFATGHYARLTRGEGCSPLVGGGRVVLRRAMDRRKDQSYFLSGLSQAQLSRMLLPLGELSKNQVRSLAREAGWDDLASRPESQNFIESKSYEALFRPGDNRPGPIHDLAGKVVGEHKGITRYTVGQRRRVGLGGRSGPLYIVGVDAAANAVTVGPKEALLAESFTAREVRWAAASPPEGSPRLLVQVRSGHPGAEGVVTPVRGGREAAVAFDEPQPALTPGQTAVFYEGDAVFGSGVIGSGVARSGVRR
ncbi:MAG: tRNA 2-thiouridine(34) synthase MnmA [Elusimicrobia bacterium]|nr:tRNA 2-thiouridine(34) synthase MnmA [Elusimicrobiota bacterium]